MQIVQIINDALFFSLLSLGLVQLSATYFRMCGLSFVGSHWGWGYTLGMICFGLGVIGLYSVSLAEQWYLLLFPLLLMPLAIGLLMTAGGGIDPPRHPDTLFEPTHPAHAGCQAIIIPDGKQMIPAYLLYPPQIKEQGLTGFSGGAVCIVPGAGDNKIGFKWRIVTKLLQAGLMVLSFDLPGHGDYHDVPLRYPDCLTTIPAVLEFLHGQPGVKKIGLLGISLGGAIAINSLVEYQADLTHYPDALVIVGTPTQLIFNKRIYYQEIWNTYRAPILSIFQESNYRQILQSMSAGKYRSPHTAADLFDLLKPLVRIKQLSPQLPILLSYGGRDGIAPIQMGQILQNAAPQAELLISPYASHVALTLINSTNDQVVTWLQQRLVEDGGLEDGRMEGLRMEDGGLEDGGLRMEDGGLRMEDGGWRVEDRGWRMEDEHNH